MIFSDFRNGATMALMTPLRRPSVTAVTFFALIAGIASAPALGFASGDDDQPARADSDQHTHQQSESQNGADDPEISFPWVGEELYYSVRINDAEGMRGGVRVGETQSRGNRHYIPIRGTAQSQGFLDAAYPIDNSVNTFVDPETTYPLRSEKTFEENDRVRTYNVDYNNRSYSADVQRFREDHESNFESAIPADTHDMLTWLYDLRQTEELSIGDRFSYFVYDGWLLSRVELEVVGREDLLTPMGWFKTWKLEFTRQIHDADRRVDTDEDGEPIPAAPEVTLEESARHTGHLWLSRDENKLPVQVTIDTPFGPSQAVLVQYTPGEPG